MGARTRARVVPRGLRSSRCRIGSSEGGGLAAAGHGAGEDVAAFERGRNAVALDRGRLGEAELVDGAHQLGVQAEGVEAANRSRGRGRTDGGRGTGVQGSLLSCGALRGPTLRPARVVPRRSFDPAAWVRKTGDLAGRGRRSRELVLAVVRSSAALSVQEGRRGVAGCRSGLLHIRPDLPSHRADLAPRSIATTSDTVPSAASLRTRGTHSLRSRGSWSRCRYSSA